MAGILVCVRDVGHRVITGGLRPDHATIARFRARHQEALGGLSSQVLRLLAAEGMVSLGMLSLDGTNRPSLAISAAELCSTGTKGDAQRVRALLDA